MALLIYIVNNLYNKSNIDCNEKFESKIYDLYTEIIN